MSEFKYVIAEWNGYRYPVIFPDKLVHADMAEALLSNLQQQAKATKSTSTPKIVSAGSIGDLEVHWLTVGSSTLGIKSTDVEDRKIDVRTIEGFSYHHGHVDLL